jgi:hypothetical protein
MTSTDRPTLHEFISTCKRRHRCKVQSLALMGPRGEVDGRLLTRTTGSLRGAVLPAIGGDDHLCLDVLESLCNRLEVPTERFGLASERTPNPVGKPAGNDPTRT